MTAPTYSAARARQLRIRCSEEELSSFTAAAQADGRTLTAWVVRVLAERIRHDSRPSEKSTRAKK